MVSRVAHNHEAVGSTPTPATKKKFLKDLTESKILLNFVKQIGKICKNVPEVRVTRLLHQMVRNSEKKVSKRFD